MSKMLMGQINHARDRVKQLKAEKIGRKPDGPKILEGDAFRKAFKADGVTVTPAKLKAAWDCYINGVLRPHVESQTHYNYDGPNWTEYTLGEQAAGSIEDALATFEYEKVNRAEIIRFNTENELFALRTEALNLKAQSVEDAIVLGDQQAALIALKDFAAFEL